MSFYNGDGAVIQVVAEEAISKYQLVKLGTVATNGQYVKKGTASSTVGVSCIGFAVESIASGASGKVQISGVARALAHDSSIAADTKLISAASGRVDGSTTNKAEIIGTAMGPAGAQDDVIEVLIGKCVLSA